ncbi:MAG TPA: glycerol-3-phosphate 1-O-acyltransferase PlsY [Stellaceae bacterium]|nr:glycerol-3-phosphate 1-O-acyltransferase PlsY [Stellaceae bacterium]
MTETLVIGAIFAYLLGSIPFGLILSRLGGYGDIRQIGSGNIGATNVLRTGNKALAGATLLLDMAKGVAAVLVLAYWGPAAAAVAAIAVFLGHLFPVWLGFRGGKGVATAGGVILAYLWPAGLAVLATWLIVAVITRYSSLAAVTASVLAPVYAWFAAKEWLPTIVVLILAALVLIRHADNIRRLLRGEESRISLGARKA